MSITIKKLKPLAESKWHAENILQDRQDGSLYASYEDLLYSFDVEVLVNQMLGSYQGDYLVILKDGDNYGYLEFGYGSCSGCDSLAGNYTLKSIEEVRDWLWASIQWKTRQEMRDFLENRNWKDHYYFDDPDMPKFLKAAKKAVK